MRQSRIVHWSVALLALAAPVAGCSDGAVEADPQLILGDPDAGGGDAQLAQDGSTAGQDTAGGDPDAAAPSDATAADPDAQVNDGGVLWGDDAAQQADAAAPSDSGVIWPGDATAQPDAGGQADTGGQVDAAVISDAAVQTDAASQADTASLPDSAAQPDSTTPPTDAGGSQPDLPPPVCGNGVCQAGENAQNCPADCQSTGGGTGTWTCGDAKCDIGEEFYCQADCLGPGCGDGVCKWPETSQACPADCKSSGGGGGGGGWVCGDGKCDIGEQFYCQKDCQVQTSPDQCLADKCSAELAKCQAKAGCMDAVNCLEKCGASWNCSQGCFSGQPASEVTSLLTCAATKGCF